MRNSSSYHFLPSNQGGRVFSLLLLQHCLLLGICMRNSSSSQKGSVLGLLLLQLEDSQRGRRSSVISLLLLLLLLLPLEGQVKVWAIIQRLLLLLVWQMKIKTIFQPPMDQW
jgi:hypothetical protein